MYIGILLVVTHSNTVLLKSEFTKNKCIFPQIEHLQKDTTDTLKAKLQRLTGFDLDVEVRGGNVGFLDKEGATRMDHIIAVCPESKIGQLKNKQDFMWFDLENSSSLPLKDFNQSTINRTYYSIDSAKIYVEEILRKKRRQWDYSRLNRNMLQSFAQICYRIDYEIHFAINPSDDLFSPEQPDMDDYLYLGFKEYERLDCPEEFTSKTMQNIELWSNSEKHSRSKKYEDSLKTLINILSARAREHAFNDDPYKFLVDIKVVQKCLDLHCSFRESLGDGELKRERAIKGAFAKSKKIKAENKKVDAVKDKIVSAIFDVVRETDKFRKRESNTNIVSRLMPIVLELLQERCATIDCDIAKDLFTNMLIENTDLIKIIEAKRAI